MAVEPTDRPEAAQQPVALNYATHVGEYPQTQAHAPFAVLLIGLTALAGVWLIILGLLNFDVLFFGLLLGGAGICVCWATLGKLSAKGMRLRAAMLLLVLGIAMNIPVVIVSHRLYVEKRTLYAHELATIQPNYDTPLTEAEHEVFTYEMIRDSALASITLAAGCCVYAASRLIARRGMDFN